MEFKLIQQIVKNIQDTVTNSVIGSSRALMKHTFPSKVVNFPKVQKINGIVSVSNQKRVEKELKVNGTTQKTILKWLKSFKPQKEIKVSNFPMQLKQPPFPTEFNVSNFPKQKEFPKNIRVTNQPTEEIKDLGKLLKQVKTAISALKLDPTIKVQAAKPDNVVVPAPQVSVTQQEIDYEKLANSFPEPVEAKEFDYEKLSDTLASRMVTVGGGRSSSSSPSFMDSDGTPGRALLNDDGTIAQPSPTGGTNPSFLISKNATGEAVYVDTTISGTTYRQTLTRSDMTIDSTLQISANVEI